MRAEKHERLSAVNMKRLFLIFLMVSYLTGNAQDVVDVHCHNVPPFYVEALEKHDAELDEGFPLPEWDAAAHLAFMDSAGIGCSILTMPAPQPYFGDSGECRETTRRYNEFCARLKAANPGKFLFCASLPLPDVDAAIAEAVYALDTLGADGIKLATNSRGQYVGDKELDPLMEVLDKRNAVVILHPHKPVPVNEKLMVAVPLAVYEYPTETTRAVMNMLAHNVLVRYPGLKVIVPHCGSFLPLALPRMKALLPVMRAKGLMGDIDFDGNFSRLYFDLAGAASSAVIRDMLTVTSPDRILYGSDYPYQPAQALTDKLRLLEKELSADKELSPYKDMFLRENAAGIFPRLPKGKKAAKAEGNAPGAEEKEGDGMLVRISEIEIYPEYKSEYLSAALKVGAVSVREEPGVIAIYPMIQQRDSCQVRILEIYADRDAYRHHLTTGHFKAYKQGTLHMVKSLDLVDMTSMNPDTMPEMFLKMKGGK